MATEDLKSAVTFFEECLRIKSVGIICCVGPTDQFTTMCNSLLAAIMKDGVESQFACTSKPLSQKLNKSVFQYSRSCSPGFIWKIDISFTVDYYMTSFPEKSFSVFVVYDEDDQHLKQQIDDALKYTSPADPMRGTLPGKSIQDYTPVNFEQTPMPFNVDDISILRTLSCPVDHSFVAISLLFDDAELSNQDDHAAWKKTLSEDPTYSVFHTEIGKFRTPCFTYSSTPLSGDYLHQIWRSLRTIPDDVGFNYHAELPLAVLFRWSNL